MLAVPVTFSLIALIVAGPTAMPLTTPVPDTVAMPVLFDVQDIVRPESVLPAASRRVTLSASVWPIEMPAVAGATVTVATGARVTVKLAVPVFPSLVAVMVAVPAPVAVTRPLELTVARALLELDHETARPVNALPLASRVLADNCTVPPTWRFAVAGVTVTVATGWSTVKLAVALFPSLVAVMVAVPAPVAVTRPPELTVAMALLELDQETARPVNTLPFASRVLADNCTVPPTWRFAVAGATVTVATGASATVTLAVPVCPSLDAVMVTVPALAPVTKPLELTVAIAVLELDQETARPVNTLPLASRVLADNCTVPPNWRFAVAGDTDTDATGIAAGALTLSDADAVFPSLAALMVAVPGATAEILPVAETVATFGFPLCQVTARSVRGFPLES
jgi:hypothetical protein